MMRNVTVSWRRIEPVTRVGIVLLVVALVSATYGYHRLHGSIDLLAIIGDFYANLSTELGSIAVTVIIIDQLNRRREEQREETALKQRLVREAGSSVQDTAIHAIEELRAHGWLEGEGCLLKGADLRRANLASTQHLRRANLAGAHLRWAKLTGVDLFGVNLIDGDLRDTYLTGAKLVATDLGGADLMKADLKGADLAEANLINANLTSAVFDRSTRLPDKTQWAPDTDIGRFTDPARLDFWRSDDPDSPAYQAEHDTHES